MNEQAIRQELNAWIKRQREALPERRSPQAHGAVEQLRDLERFAEEFFGPENSCLASAESRSACVDLSRDLPEIACPCGWSDEEHDPREHRPTMPQEHHVIELAVDDHRFAALEAARARWEAANAPVPDGGWDALPDEERQAWLEKPLGECDWCRQAVTGPKPLDCVNPEHVGRYAALRRAARYIRRDLCYGGSALEFYSAVADWLEREANLGDRVVEPGMYGEADDLAVRAARGFLGTRG